MSPAENPTPTGAYSLDFPPPVLLSSDTALEIAARKRKRSASPESTETTRSRKRIANCTSPSVATCRISSRSSHSPTPGAGSEPGSPLNKRHHSSSHENDTSCSRREEEWGYIMKNAAQDEKLKPVSTTSAGFRQQLTRNKVFEAIESPPPANLEEIEALLDTDRQSTCPDADDFMEYQQCVIQAPNEVTLRMQTTVRVLKRTRRKARKDGKTIPYCQVSEQYFSKTPRDCGFNNGITPPKPDDAFGFRWSAFNNGIHNIPGLIPNDSNYCVALPHLFCEYKTPGGAYHEAEAQAAYDGAYGVYMRRKALHAIGLEEPRGEAHVFSIATDGTTHRIFAHFSGQGSPTPYYQYQVCKGGEMMTTHDAYKMMLKRTHNVQDLAFKNANELRRGIDAFYTSKAPQQHMHIPGVEEDHQMLTPTGSKTSSRKRPASPDSLIDDESADRVGHSSIESGCPQDMNR